MNLNRKADIRAFIEGLEQRRKTEPPVDKELWLPICECVTAVMESNDGGLARADTAMKFLSALLEIGKRHGGDELLRQIDLAYADLLCGCMSWQERLDDERRTRKTGKTKGPE